MFHSTSLKANIEKYRVEGFAKIWDPEIGGGRYRNPILHADYSDPDVIEVDGVFYLVASSFNHTPGLPLLRSYDMLHWEIVNHLLPKLPFPRYETPLYGAGVWAPAIRYHQKKFYVYFPLVDEGIFLITATDPLGKWSEPICVKAAPGWIDPCPFWDDDGKAYLAHAFAKSRTGICDILAISPMNDEGTALTGEYQIVFDAKGRHPYVEGPKVHKRNGYYYIFAPGGGVPQGWQIVLRSKNIYGPYEERVVLHKGDTEINGPHQGAWVETKNGDSWFFHFQDAGAYGRIVHLQPVRWVDDWPEMGVDRNGDGIGEPVLSWEKPEVSTTKPLQNLQGDGRFSCTPATSDDFNSTNLGLQWQWPANFKTEWYSLTERPGSIRLYCNPFPELSKSDLGLRSNLLMQKFPARKFQLTTSVIPTLKNDGDECGIVVMGQSYSSFTLLFANGVTSLVQKVGVLPSGRNDGATSSKSLCQSYKDQTVWKSDSFPLHQIQGKEIFLKVEVGNDASFSFSFSTDNNIFTRVGEVCETTNSLFTGSKVGLFSSNELTTASGGWCDFDWVVVEENRVKSEICNNSQDEV